MIKLHLKMALPCTRCTVKLHYSYRDIALKLHYTRNTTRARLHSLHCNYAQCTRYNGRATQGYDFWCDAQQNTLVDSSFMLQCARAPLQSTRSQWDCTFCAFYLRRERPYVTILPPHETSIGTHHLTIGRTRGRISRPGLRALSCLGLFI